MFYSIHTINADRTVLSVNPMTKEVVMLKSVQVEDTENGRYDLVIRCVKL